MSSLFSTFLFLAMAGHTSAMWCICKEGMSDSMLQKTLDYACGYGADCNPIHQNGPCYQPNTVRAHCSYAVNSFFQKKGQASGTCDFSSTASITTNNPSISGCFYPTSASGTTPSTGSPSTTTTATGNSPVITTPTGDSLGGGVNNGIGPAGLADVNHGGTLLLINAIIPSITLIVSALLA